MSDVLKRKLGAMQTPKPPVGASVEGVLRKTMPRDADAVLSLDVAVTSFSTGSLEKTDLLATLQATDLLITEVRLSEGRLKDSYRFEHRGSVLTVYDLSLKAGDRITLFFDYYILPDIDHQKRLLLESEDLLVLLPED